MPFEDLTPTDEQSAILDGFEEGKHLAVTALAGTGKTSTLRLCSESAGRRKKGVYFAFNRAIADDAEATFPANTTCRTVHSLAYRALGYQFRQRVNARRRPPWEVAKDLDIDDFEAGGIHLNAMRCATLARDMVTRFTHTSDSQIALEHVPFVRGLEAQREPDGNVLSPDLHPELAMHLLPHALAYWSDVQSPVGRLNFFPDDYLKMWALTHPELAGDFLLIDEGQDLNGVMVGLTEDQSHMQLVIVGDANQQIYQWRGSMNAMEIFPVDHKLPLTQSWRFGPEIAAAANIFLEELGTPLRLRGNPDKESRIGISAHPSAILCRTNAGCLQMLIGAVQNGRKVFMPGNRPAELKSFCNAAVAMKAGKITTHRDLTAFATWTDVLDYSRMTDDGDFALMVRLIERYGAENLLRALNSLVEPDYADLVIGTGHSAKGLEWPEVQIAGDFERKDEEGETIPPDDGELRLRYVTVTRAREVLDPGPLAEDLGLDPSEGSQTAMEDDAPAAD